MAKDKFIADLDKFSEKLQGFIELATSTNTLDVYAELAKGKIQQRTRAGRGVNFPNQLGGGSVKLEALSTKYKSYRKKNRGELGTGASPVKSSLTFSGQMLASLKAKVKPRGKIEIAVTGQRNKDLARWHAEGKGNLPKRVFLGLTRKDLTDINKEFGKTFSDTIRKFFK